MKTTAGSVLGLCVAYRTVECTCGCELYGLLTRLDRWVEVASKPFLDSLGSLDTDSRTLILVERGEGRIGEAESGRGNPCRPGRQ